MPGSSLRRWLSTCMGFARHALGQQHYVPSPGQIDFGDLRQTRLLGPSADTVGEVVAYYIEEFFRREAQCVRGRVLEIGHEPYTSTVAGHGIAATSIGFSDDAALTQHLADLEDNSFDTLLLAQVLQAIYQLDIVVKHAHRLLAPGGILLATVPGCCDAGYGTREMKPYWGFTDVSLRQLMASVFPERATDIETYGNVKVAMVALHRLSLAELTPKELNHRDEHYPLLLSVKTQKLPA